MERCINAIELVYDKILRSGGRWKKLDSTLCGEDLNVPSMCITRTL